MMAGNDTTLSSVGVAPADALALLRDLAITSLQKSCAILYTFAASARDASVAQPEHAHAAQTDLPEPVVPMPSQNAPLSHAQLQVAQPAQPTPSLPSPAQHAQPTHAQPMHPLPSHAQHASAWPAPGQPSELVSTSLPHMAAANIVTMPAPVPTMTPLPHVLQPSAAARENQPAPKRPRTHAAHPELLTTSQCPLAANTPPRQRRRLSHHDNATQTPPTPASTYMRTSVTANMMEIEAPAAFGTQQSAHPASNSTTRTPSALVHTPDCASTSHLSSLPARRNFDPGG